MKGKLIHNFKKFGFVTINKEHDVYSVTITKNGTLKGFAIYEGDKERLTQMVKFLEKTL